MSLYQLRSILPATHLPYTPSSRLVYCIVTGNFCLTLKPDREQQLALTISCLLCLSDLTFLLLIFPKTKSSFMDSFLLLNLFKNLMLRLYRDGRPRLGETRRCPMWFDLIKVFTVQRNVFLLMSIILVYLYIVMTWRLLKLFSIMFYHPLSPNRLVSCHQRQYHSS